MGASIFIGKNTGQRDSENLLTGDFVNRNYWDAFGDLLDEVFLPNYPKLHESMVILLLLIK